MCDYGLLVLSLAVPAVQLNTPKGKRRKGKGLVKVERLAKSFSRKHFPYVIHTRGHVTETYPGRPLAGRGN